MKTFHIVVFLLCLFTINESSGQSSTKIQKHKLPQKESQSKVIANYGVYNFSFKSLDGKLTRLSEYAGKTVLVNIWAPWCEPCKKEAEGFAKLYKEYHIKGFYIIGIAVQTTEAAVRTFMQENHIVWNIGIKDEITTAYKTIGIPQSILFRGDGSVIKEFIGYTDEKALEPLLRQELKIGN